MTCHNTANPGHPRDNRGRYLKLPPVESCETFNDSPEPDDGHEDNIRLMIIVSLAVALALSAGVLLVKVTLGGAV